MKKFLAVLVLLGILALPGQAFAQAKIWLSADGASYVNASSDPWITESWVIGSGDFNLDILNTSKTDTIYNTMLVLSIPHDITDTGWSFTLGGNTFNQASFTGTGLHPVISPHGVFAKVDGALWTELNVGNIAPEATTQLAFSGTAPTDGVFLHFDAYGHDASGAPSFNNPYSHDVTVTPEPMALILYGLGGLPIAAHLLRRRKTAA